MKYLKRWRGCPQMRFVGRAAAGSLAGGGIFVAALNDARIRRIRAVEDIPT